MRAHLYKHLCALKSVLLISSVAALFAHHAGAEVKLEAQVKISDVGLHFDGKNLDHGNVDAPDTGEKYDYFFGRSISAHGDSVKVYKHYVFMTWYRGGKFDRHVMLSRYNTQTGTVATIEFPHRHTGFRGDPLVGESHNTIGLAVSPLNGTIHMVYDMHAYDDNNHGGKFKNDYFRYSFSLAGAAEVPDEQFTLDQFVKDTSAVSQGPDDYKHLTMTGNLADKGNFARLTYPKFFVTNDGTLLLYMRLGGNNNGGYVFNRYDAATQKWSTFTEFNVVTAKSFGNAYNWGLYGNMKYINGKLRVGFQQRSSINTDRYVYQNGVYYAYSDHPEGFGQWKNHKGESMTWPLVNSDEIKVFEPGDYFTGHTDANSVYIVDGFDWTVTAKGDIHMISKVRSANSKRADYQEVMLHSYKPAGASDFIVSTEFSGAEEIYTAGDNVYIIGLNNGRPFVERAKGGTNEFVRVYEATEGIQFDHGAIEVHEGKVYYYLMEKGAGTALPLHLQVIDLDLTNDSSNPVATAPNVNFPSSTMTVDEGFKQLSLTIDASSPVEGRSIESVSLYINDVLVRTDNSVPYLFGHASQPHETGALGWLDTHTTNPNPLGAGVHTFKAVAVDSAGESSTATMKLTVKSSAQPPIISFPNNEVTLTESFPQFTFTLPGSSPVAGVSIKSVTLYIDGNLVRVDTRSPWNFGHSLAPHETGAMGWLSTHTPNPNPLSVGTHIFTAVAVDTAGLESTATMRVTVLEREPAPTVNFNESDIELVQGYKSLSVSADVETANENIGVTSASLYINEQLVRTDYQAPFAWGDLGYEAELLGLTAGEHEFKLVVTDSNNKVGEASMLVTITNAPALLGDLDSDGDVDRNDVRLFSTAVRTNSITDLAYDFNKDGLINSSDVRGVALLCTRSGCATE